MRYNLSRWFELESYGFDLLGSNDGLVAAFAPLELNRLE